MVETLSQLEVEKVDKTMRIGIVGSEAIKFTKEGETKAKNLIRYLLAGTDVTEVVSGGCHLGGIDIWAEEIGREFNLKVTVFKPLERNWEHYKQRNLQIVNGSDEVDCITINRLPDNYVGMKFDLCYHCKSKTHIKSGGCWTMHKAKSINKVGKLYIIQQ